MKKIFLILTMFTTNVFATEMCARNDVVVIPLDAAAPSTGGTFFENIDWRFGNSFGYGPVRGLATCLTNPEATSLTITGDTWYGLLKTRDYDLAGLYSDNDNDENPRSVCCCKITNPVSSRWFCIKDKTTSTSCYSACSAECTAALRDHHTFRETMFKSIGI